MPPWKKPFAWSRSSAVTIPVFALVAFGGAGGLHACELAQSLGIPRVIIPAIPGALSAFGILVSDVVKDYSRTVLLRVTANCPPAPLAQEFAQHLKIAPKRIFVRESWRGRPLATQRSTCAISGQGYRTQCAMVPPNSFTDFRHAHEQRYGYVYWGGRSNWSPFDSAPV